MSGIDLAECVRSGYAVWNRNQVLGAPYLLAVVSVLGFFAVMVAATAVSFTVFGKLVGVLTAVLTVFASIAAVIIIPAFYTAAAIRMAEKALGGGSLGVMDSFSPDARAVWRLTLFYVLTWLVAGALLVPMLLAQIFLKVNVFTLFGLALGCGLMFVPYNLVLTKRGIVKSLMDGFDTFRKNWTAAGLLYGLASYVGQLVGFAAVPVAFVVLSGFTPFSEYAFGFQARTLVVQTLFMGFALFMVVTILFSTLVLAPLTTLWQLDLYRRVGGLRDDS